MFYTPRNKFWIKSTVLIMLNIANKDDIIWFIINYKLLFLINVHCMNGQWCQCKIDICNIDWSWNNFSQYTLVVNGYDLMVSYDTHWYL